MSKRKSNKKLVPRNEAHFTAQLKYPGAVTKDKKKIIPRKQKNNRIEY